MSRETRRVSGNRALEGRSRTLDSSRQGGMVRGEGDAEKIYRSEGRLETRRKYWVGLYGVLNGSFSSPPLRVSFFFSFLRERVKKMKQKNWASQGRGKEGKARGEKGFSPSSRKVVAVDGNGGNLVEWGGSRE